jgi:hypothetical protein
MTGVMPENKVYKCVTTNGLNKTLPEAAKLVTLILTVPETSPLVERPFSALIRVRTYPLK